MLNIKDYGKKEKIALEIWAEHKNVIIDEMRSKQVSRELAWLAGFFKKQPGKLTSEELFTVLGIRLRTHLATYDREAAHDLDFIFKFKVLDLEHKLALCAEFCAYASREVAKGDGRFVEFQWRFLKPTLLLADYLIQHLLRADQMTRAHKILLWRAKTKQQNDDINQIKNQFDELAQLLLESQDRAIEGERKKTPNTINPIMTIFPTVTDLGSDFLFECAGDLSYFCLPMDRGPTTNKSIRAESWQAFSELLKGYHGLKSVLPTVFLKGGSDQAEFQRRVHTREYQQEIKEDTDRSLSADLERLGKSLETKIVGPLQLRARKISAHPGLRYIRIDRDSPLSFLPLNSAVLGDKNLHRPLPFDQRKKTYPPIGYRKSQLKCRMLIIRDPSESLPFEDVEVHGLTQANIFGQTVTMTLSQLLDAHNSGSLEEYDIVHFIGHHSITYSGGIISKIPTTSGSISANVLWEAFTKTNCRLVFLSACATSSTYFTDRNARSDAFAMQCSDRVGCNVMSTLWPIFDLSAAHFAARYYRNLGVALGDPFEALFTTQQEFAAGDVTVNANPDATSQQRLGGHRRATAYTLQGPVHWAGYVLN